MKAFKTLTVFAATSIIAYSNFIPAVYAWKLPGKYVGELAGSAAQALGANKTISKAIANGVGMVAGDPTAQANLIVNAMKDTGIIGDAASCQAMSDLTATGASLVAAYYTGGAGAGIAGKLGGTVMNGACKESFGPLTNPRNVEAVKQQYQQVYESQKQQIQSQEKIVLAQIEAGKRIVELQSQAKIQEAKIMAESALAVENTRQDGETKRAIIQAQNLLEMTNLNNEKELKLAYIDLQKVQVTEQAAIDKTQIIAASEVKIAQLQSEGRVQEAQILAEEVVQTKKLEAEAQKATSQNAKDAAVKVAEVQYNALRKMNESTNAVETEKIRQEAKTKKRELSAKLQLGGLDLVGKVILALLETGVKKREIDAELKIAQMQAQSSQPSPVSQQQATNSVTSAADRLLAEWGWTKVACYSGAVFITGLGKDEICVNPSAVITSGQYRYESASNQLIPLTAVSNSVTTPVQPAFNTVPVQNVEPQDTVGF